MKIIYIEDNNNSENIYHFPINLPLGRFGYDPCQSCTNNPKNNSYSSGMCCCSLPDLYSSRYVNTTSTLNDFNNFFEDYTIS